MPTPKTLSYISINSMMPNVMTALNTSLYQDRQLVQAALSRIWVKTKTVEGTATIKPGDGVFLAQDLIGGQLTPKKFLETLNVTISSQVKESTTPPEPPLAKSLWARTRIHRPTGGSK